MAPVPGKSGPPGPPAKGGKLGAWVKKNPGMAAALAGAAALGAFVLIKKGSAANAADPGAADTSTIGTVDPSLYGTPSDLGGVGSSDDLSGLEDQLTSLQSMLQGITQAQAPPQSSGGGTGKTPAPKKPGKGAYQPNQKHWLSGAQYQELKKAGKGAYGAAGGRYTGARGWAYLQKHPVGRPQRPK